MDSPVVVIGGSGRLGRLVVNRLLDLGERVHVVGRGTPQEALPDGVGYTAADVRERGSLDEPLANCSALVYCVSPGTDDTGPDRPETTMYLGVRNALRSAVGAGRRPHVVLVSQIHATHYGHPLNAYGRVLDWRRAGEDEVRESGLSHTVVRPGWLLDDQRAGSRVRLVQGDRGTGQVSRQDAAEACIQAMYCPSAIGVTFELFNESGPAVTDWESSFAALEWDRIPVG